MEIKKYLGILLLASMYSGLSFAQTTWAKLKNEENYQLKSNLYIINSPIYFQGQSLVKIIERTTLATINLEVIKAKFFKCDQNEAISDLELYSIWGASVAIELTKPCTLEIFIELKDLNRNSLFL